MNAVGVDDVILLVANREQVPPRALVSPGRGSRPIGRARTLAMYLCHVGLGLSLTKVGLAFGRDRVTVHCAVVRVEDRRDDPRFDAELTALEERLTLPAPGLAR